MSEAVAYAPHNERYDRVTIAFHWVTALLVVVLWGTAVARNLAPREWHWRALEGVHISLGILLAIVIVARLAWRAFAGRRLEAAGTGLSALLARLAHAALYVLLVAQVGLGFGLRWLQGEDFSFFGWFSIPGLFTPDRDIAHQLQFAHNFVGWALIYVAGAHALAALFHRYVLKDRVLGRMLPRARISRPSRHPGGA